MKRLIILSLLTLFIAGCDKKGGGDTPQTPLQIDSKNLVVEGSYVAGQELNDLCKIAIPYSKSPGVSAKVIAPQVNGIQIAEQTVTLSEGSGTAKVDITGTPVAEMETVLNIKVTADGKDFTGKVTITVIADPGPTEIIFTLEDDPIMGFTETVVRNFTVEPAEAAVLMTSTANENLDVLIDNNEDGTGTVTFTPKGIFLSLDVEISASFGSITPEKATVHVNQFNTGTGTAESPYEVETDNHFAMIPYGPGKAFKLMDDFKLETWAPLGTQSAKFTGVFDGNGKTVEFTLDMPEDDNVAFFGFIGSSGVVKNLTLKGSVTGNSNVAALAADNAGDVSENNDVSDVLVTGSNNVAAVAASGTNKDEKVITFTDVPDSIDIEMGESGKTVDLGVAPFDAYIDLSKSPEGSELAYDSETGKLTIEKSEALFKNGDIEFTVSLAGEGDGANVKSTLKVIPVTAVKMYESGTGIEDDPYVVINKAQFMMVFSRFENTHIKLAGDIEFEPGTFNSNGVYTAREWTVAAKNTEFSGSIDGNGHKIIGLTDPLVSLLTGTIQNIHFVNAHLARNDRNLGIVAEFSGEGAKILNCTATGKIFRDGGARGDNPQGGLVAEIQGGTIIDNCYVNLDMSYVPSCWGGIVGRISTPASGTSSTISNCTSEGSIFVDQAQSKIGGILGRKASGATGDVIKNCRSTMSIRASGNDGKGEHSNMIGGIFGAMQPSYSATSPALVINECVFEGTIIGGYQLGGIAGVGPSLTNCMVIGQGPASETPTIKGLQGKNGAVSGIMSSSKGFITNCIVYNAAIQGPPASARQSAGIVCTRDGATFTVNGCVVANTSVTAPDEETAPGGGRAITGDNVSQITSTNNYRYNITYSDGSAFVPLNPDARNQDGAAMTSENFTQSWFEALGYDFTDVWKWDSAKNIPVLKNAGSTIQPPL